MSESAVFFSISQIKIVTAQHLLSEAGIESHTINKMDSAHAGLFGEIELYVAKDKESDAREILTQAEIIKS